MNKPNHNGTESLIEFLDEAGTRVEASLQGSSEDETRCTWTIPRAGPPMLLVSLTSRGFTICDATKHSHPPVLLPDGRPMTDPDTIHAHILKVLASHPAVQG